MKRILSVILSLALLASLLIIPMSVSAAAEINSETLISGIKTAAANLQYKESTKQQFLVPLGVYAVSNPSHSKTLSAEDTSGSEGTPLLVKFDGDIKDMPDQVAQRGAGHHWVGIHGDWAETFRLLSRMSQLDYEQLKPM